MTPVARETPMQTRLAERWFERRTYAGAVDPREVAARARAAGLSISVVLPALNEEATIGAICRSITDELPDLVTELIVIDGGSTDRTAPEAHAGGARVVPVASLVPEIAPVRGKGESLWRSLSVVDGDIVCWIDADIRNFSPHFVTRLVAPLVRDPSLAFVKAFYRRPIALDGTLAPEGGGRVTELLARPLLNAFFPELGGIVQPLSGEYAGRREVLEELPFFTGYSVEVGLLIDLLDHVGLDAIGQADLEERVHRNRPLTELSPMAYAIARAILRRAEEWGRVKAAFDYTTLPLMQPADGEIAHRDVLELERPPVAVLSDSLAALGAV